MVLGFHTMLEIDRPQFDTPHRVSRVRIWVPFYDADPMGIVHHANYLRYFENARIEWFRRRGVTQASVAGPDLNLAVVESRVWYRSAARFDDTLIIDVALAEMKHVSMDFAYRALVQEADEVRLIAEGKTTHACVAKDLRLKKIPKQMRQMLLEQNELDEYSSDRLR